MKYIKTFEEINIQKQDLVDLLNKLLDNKYTVKTVNGFINPSHKKVLFIHNGYNEILFNDDYLSQFMIDSLIERYEYMYNYYSKKDELSGIEKLRFALTKNLLDVLKNIDDDVILGDEFGLL